MFCRIIFETHSINMKQLLQHKGYFWQEYLIGLGHIFENTYFVLFLEWLLEEISYTMCIYLIKPYVIKYVFWTQISFDRSYGLITDSEFMWFWVNETLDYNNTGGVGAPFYKKFAIKDNLRIKMTYLSINDESLRM